MIDLHLHPGWTYFNPQAQKKRSPEEIKQRIETFWKIYAEKGITLSRDAGGYEEADSRIIACAGMITQWNYDREDFLRQVLSGSGEWVKIFATGGVGAAPETVIDPLIPKEAFQNLVSRLHRHGKKVMVHCWGGDSLTWSIEAGVESMEHGVYLTEEQAGRMAEREIPLIPTTAVYRLLAEKPELFSIPKLLQEHAKRACEGHSRAIRYALSAGVLIGHGTDFYADPELAEYAGYEREVLQEYGLSEKQAIEAGTTVAERILGMR